MVSAGSFVMTFGNAHIVVDEWNHFRKSAITSDVVINKKFLCTPYIPEFLL